MNENTEARNVMTRRQSFDASKLLEEHLHKLPGSESMYEYDKEWSDARVAEEIKLNSKWAPQVIGRLRLELFGKISSNRTGGPSGERIEALEGTVRALQANLAVVLNTLQDLQGRHEKLCTSLSLHKVLDVRHLGKEQKTNGATATK